MRRNLCTPSNRECALGAYVFLPPSAFHVVAGCEKFLSFIFVLFSLSRLSINFCFLLLDQRLWWSWKKFLNSRVKFRDILQNLFLDNLRSSFAISCCDPLLGFPWNFCASLILLSFRSDGNGFVTLQGRILQLGDHHPLHTIAWYVRMDFRQWRLHAAASKTSIQHRNWHYLKSFSIIESGSRRTR